MCCVGIPQIIIKKKAGCAGIRQIIISGDYIDSFNCHRYRTIGYQLKFDINQTLQDQDRRVLVRLILTSKI